MTGTIIIDPTEKAGVVGPFCDIGGLAPCLRVYGRNITEHPLFKSEVEIGGGLLLLCPRRARVGAASLNAVAALVVDG